MGGATIGVVGNEDQRFSSRMRWKIVRLLPDPRGAVVGDANGKLALYPEGEPMSSENSANDEPRNEGCGIGGSG